MKNRRRTHRRRSPSERGVQSTAGKRTDGSRRRPNFRNRNAGLRPRRPRAPPPRRKRLRLKFEAEEAARLKEEKRLQDLALGPKPSNANYGESIFYSRTGN